MRNLTAAVVFVTAFAGCVDPSPANTEPSSETVDLRQEAVSSAVPVLYITDLFHPKIDADDHFDAAAIYALPGVDVRGIVIDQAGNVFGSPPLAIPLDQLNWLSGKSVPYALGARTALANPSDTLAAESDVDGIELILRELQASEQRMTVVSVGSARDLAAAFNRNPDLLRDKVDRVFLFAGDGRDNSPVEWNVALDPYAYVAVLRSGLDVYWIPCWEGGVPNVLSPYRASHWSSNLGELLAGASPPIVQFFLYMWSNADPNSENKFDALTLPVNTTRRNDLFGNSKDLYSTAVFTEITGRNIVFDSTTSRYRSLSPGAALPPGSTAAPLWRWNTVDADPSNVPGQPGSSGVTHYGPSATSRSVKQFQLVDANEWADGATDVTAELFSMTQNWPAPAPRTGLIAGWRFDDSRASRAVDVSGSGYDGLSSGPLTRVSDGHAGSAARFSGGNGYVVSWGALTGNAPRTMATWFRTTSAADSNWLSWGTSWPNQMSQLGSSGGKIGYLGYLNDLTVDGAALRNGAWHHLVVTFDGAMLRLYVDGALAASRATTLATAAGPLALGRSASGLFPYSGDLDSVLVYDRALTATEVAALANAP